MYVRKDILFGRWLELSWARPGSTRRVRPCGPYIRASRPYAVLNLFLFFPKNPYRGFLGSLGKNKINIRWCDTYIAHTWHVTWHTHIHVTHTWTMTEHTANPPDNEATVAVFSFLCYFLLLDLSELDITDRLFQPGPNAGSDSISLYLLGIPL